MIHPKIDSDRPQLVSKEHAEKMVLEERERCAGIAERAERALTDRCAAALSSVVRQHYAVRANTAGIIAAAIRKGDE